MSRQASLLCLVPAESLHALHSNQLEHLSSSCQLTAEHELLLRYGPSFTFSRPKAECVICAIEIHICLDQASNAAGPLLHRHMLGAPCAGEPSLKHELAKSLHAGDIAVLEHVRGLATNNLWAFAPFLVEPLNYMHEAAFERWKVRLMQTPNSIAIFMIGCLVLR